MKFLSARRRLRSILQGSVCLMGWVTYQVPPVQAATVNSAKITQILDGPHVFIQNRQVKVNATASRGQRIRTGRSRAQLKFNTGAVGRLAHNSSLVIGQCARLQHGSMLVNGAINGCSYSAVAGVRGTTYLLEVDGKGASTIKVLEGEVMVTRSMLPISQDEDQTDAEATPLQGKLADSRIAPVNLKAGEKVQLSAAGYPSQVERFEQPEFSRIVTGTWVRDYEEPLPGSKKIRQSYEAQFPDQSFPKVQACGTGIPDSIRVRFPKTYDFLKSNICPQ
ncbi:hypothetical protein ACKFKF_04685 [Phormidesmis sp. 146-12]